VSRAGDVKWLRFLKLRIREARKVSSRLQCYGACVAAKADIRHENEVGVSRAICGKLAGKLRGRWVIAHSRVCLRVCDACGVYELRQTT